VEPGNDIPGSCDLAEIHPLSCRVVVVSCPTAKRAQTVCSTVRVSGPPDSSVRVLALKLPRRYAALELACAAGRSGGIACRSLSRRLVAAVGIRVVGVRLPERFSTLRIFCGSDKRGFSCRLAR
jgi:hypothetical protein